MTDDRTESGKSAPPPKADEGRMTIWEHIAEFRNRIIKCAVAIVVGSVIGFMVYPYVFEWLIEPYKQVVPNPSLFAPSLLEPLTIRMQGALCLGLVMAMPVLMWQLWRFVTPAMYAHEKRYAIPFTASAMVLFLSGAAIARLIMPLTIEFLVNISGIQEVTLVTSISSYFKLSLFMMVAFGIGFEFPVVLVALQLIGVLSPRKLLGWWRYATVTLALAAAIITPSGDPISMLALAVPMEILYFVSIGVGALVLWRRAKSATPAPAAPAA